VPISSKTLRRRPFPEPKRIPAIVSLRRPSADVSTVASGDRSVAHLMDHSTDLRKSNPRLSRAEDEDSRVALAGLAHDARNMFAALSLYCDLLAEPGVLTPRYFHYADELKLVAQAGGRLVERLGTAAAETQPASGVFSTPIDNLGREVARAQSLLTALAGAAVTVEIECLPCPGRLRLSTEDLTRILVNLVRNACEALPEGGRIRVTAQKGGGTSFLTERAATSGARPTVLVCVQDNGPGIPPEALERIFQPGFTTKSTRSPDRNWAAPTHRGFGLSIVRSLAESAGGVTRVLSRQGRGTRIEVEIPLVTSAREIGDSQEGTRVQC
jgi:signal transduction histidine kinase